MVVVWGWGWGGVWGVREGVGGWGVFVDEGVWVGGVWGWGGVKRGGGGGRRLGGEGKGRCGGRSGERRGRRRYSGRAGGGVGGDGVRCGMSNKKNKTNKQVATKAVDQIRGIEHIMNANR